MAESAARGYGSEEAIIAARPDRAPAGAVDQPPVAGARLLHYAPALVFLAIVIADCGRYADTDLWGHLRFGQLLLQRGPYPGPDPYSYAPRWPVWLHHEWLAEVLMAWLYARSGVVGLKLWKFACSAATLVLVATAEGETAAPLALQLVVLLTIACGLIPYMQFRPLLFSYVFTAAIIALVTRDNYRGKAVPWLVIPGFALWANLHGSYFVGLGILGIYTAVRGSSDLAARRGAGRGLRLGMITAASSLATLATPYGIATWRAVAISLRNPMTRHVMADWRPLLTVLAEARGESHGGALFLWIALALILACALSCLLAPRGDDLALVAVAGAINLGAFMAVRNVPLALIASAAPLTRHLGGALRRRPAPAPAAVTGMASRRDPGLSWRAQAVIVFLGLVMLVSGGVGSPRLRAAANYPDGAVAFMDAHHLHGNILNYFAWGQYLIWHEAPVSKVFIDGRYDLVYPPAIVRQYLAFYTAQPAAVNDLLDGYPHDYILLPAHCAVVRLLNSRNDWRLVYRDAVAVLYARAASPVARATAAPASGAAYPSYFP